MRIEGSYGYDQFLHGWGMANSRMSRAMEILTSGDLDYLAYGLTELAIAETQMGASIEVFRTQREVDRMILDILV